MFVGILPTGKQVSGTGKFIDRIVNGKAVEQWGNSDTLGLSLLRDNYLCL